MIHYKIKQKKFKNNTCKTFSHIDENGDKVWKNKKKFDTLDEAIKEAKRINNLNKTIHKVVSYKCTVCYKYHIGRNGKLVK
jgi:hypothetical protein